MACIDPSTQQLETVCKLGSGLSDAMLQDCTARLQRNATTVRNHETPSLVVTSFSIGSLQVPPPGVLHAKKMEPDVWFEPAEVSHRIN